MYKYCPNCGIEMIDKNQVSICPRNDIGECSYDGYQNSVATKSEDYSIVEFDKATKKVCSSSAQA